MTDTSDRQRTIDSYAALAGSYQLGLIRLLEAEIAALKRKPHYRSFTELMYGSTQLMGTPRMSLNHYGRSPSRSSMRFAI